MTKKRAGGSVFSDLATIVDLIRKAVSAIKRFRNKKARADAILELLIIYFVLTDVVEEGRALLNSAGPDPKKKLAGLSQAEAAKLIVAWDRAISRQASRLYSLSGRILGQDALAVIDPTLTSRLKKLVGSKFDRTRNLEGIVAGLVMYSIFGFKTDEDSQRDVLLSMYPKRTSRALNLENALAELQQLEQALEVFRKVCLQLASKNEILLLSQKARKQTRMSESFKPI